MTLTEPSASTGTPTLPPPPTTPIDMQGSGAGDDGKKKPPRPGSMASEPLDVLLAKWRQPFDWSAEDASVEALGRHGARAMLADAIDYARVRGVSYADVLNLLDDVFSELPDAPDFDPAEEAVA